jgi:hypothetical protein
LKRSGSHRFGLWELGAKSLTVDRVRGSLDGLPTLQAIGWSSAICGCYKSFRRWLLIYFISTKLNLASNHPALLPCYPSEERIVFPTQMIQYIWRPGSLDVGRAV